MHRLFGSIKMVLPVLLIIGVSNCSYNETVGITSDESSQLPMVDLDTMNGEHATIAFSTFDKENGKINYNIENEENPNATLQTRVVITAPTTGKKYGMTIDSTEVTEDAKGNLIATADDGENAAVVVLNQEEGTVKGLVGKSSQLRSWLKVGAVVSALAVAGGAAMYLGKCFWSRVLTRGNKGETVMDEKEAKAARSERDQQKEERISKIEELIRDRMSKDSQFKELMIQATNVEKAKSKALKEGAKDVEVRVLNVDYLVEGSKNSYVVELAAVAVNEKGEVSKTYVPDQTAKLESGSFTDLDTLRDLTLVSAKERDSTKDFESKGRGILSDLLKLDVEKRSVEESRVFDARMKESMERISRMRSERPAARIKAL